MNNSQQQTYPQDGLNNSEVPEYNSSDTKGQYEPMVNLDTGYQDNINRPTNNSSSAIGSCLVGLIPLAILIIFIFFGRRIFGFFNIENIYNFIISIFILILVYIASIIVLGFFFKNPTDILTISSDRFMRKKIQAN